jgi:hypothetical protein
VSGAERPKRQVPVEKTKLILVEGVDEQRFFEALLGHLGIPDVQIVAVGGKSRFGATLSAIKIDERFEDVRSIVLVRDADWEHPQGTNAKAAWEALGGALQGAGIPRPSAHAVLQGTTELKTAVYVMPDGTSDGMLEDLCLRAMREDKALPRLDDYFACLKEAGFEHAAKDAAKARAHALLASRKDPDLRVGEAAKRGYWPFDADAFKPLVALLRALQTG